MAAEQQILALLTGRKVFDGVKWHVFDADGNELADPAGVLWRGVHGALLWNANNTAEPVNYVPMGYGPMVHPVRKELVRSKRKRQNEAILLTLMM